MRSLFSSLRLRLLVLVLVAIVPAILIQFYTNRAERDFNTQQIRQTLALSSDISAGNLQQVVEGTRQLMSAVAEMPAVRRLELDAAREVFVRLRAANPQYDNIGLVDANGDLLTTALPPPTTPVNIADRSYFKLAKSTRAFAVGELINARITGNKTFAFTHPVFDADGVLVGVLSASMNLDWLNQSVASTDLPEGSGHVVVDAVGIVVTRYPEPDAWVGFDSTQTPIGREVLARRTGTAEVAGLDGRIRLFSFRPVPGTDERLFVWVGIPPQVAFSAADALLRRNLAVLLLAALAALGLAWFVAGAFVARPVNSLVQAAGRLAAGDLSARSGLAAGPGELDRLSVAFDSMADTLQQRQEQLERAAAEVCALNEDLENRVACRTDELQAANREMESFTYSVSHDLRSPLRAINGFAALLVQDYGDRLDAEGVRRLQVIRDNASRMARLIDGLLDLGRLGRAELAPAPVDMAQIAHEAWHELVSVEPDCPIRLDLGDLPHVRGDRVLLRQVWVNLLSNAVKFSRPKAPAVVEVGGRVEGGEAVFFVRDQGVGFDPDYAHKLFGLFHRLHSLDDFEGTGVGLALVQRIVQRHGGRVWAESRLGEGATFTFSLPAECVMSNA